MGNPPHHNNLTNRHEQETIMEQTATHSVSLAETVEQTVKQYLESVEIKDVTNLYDLLLEQVEPVLFKTVVEHCRYNQSRAAAILGLSRGTCRKKLIQYFDNQYCGTREG